MSTTPPANVSWWHVVWTTRLSWLPSDPRGDWRSLAALYESLRQAGISVTMSAPLPRLWQGRPAPAGQVLLSPAARVQLAADVLALTATEGGRVAGDTPVRALAVAAEWVQSVMACPEAALHHRMRRLKSRTATLLSFRPELGAGGRGTWSRGIWWARLDGEDSVSHVSAFVAALAAPVDRERVAPGGSPPASP